MKDEKAVVIGFIVIHLFARVASMAAERTENFDKDPGWDGHNNRAKTPAPRSIRQDFGYSAATAHCGSAPGELGGLITPAGEPAYYAKEIPTKTFDDTLSASGKLVCAGRQFHALVGFFNSNTVNEWRTPNSIALRLYGRGDVFFAYVEYMTKRWRAGGDSPGGFATVRDPATGRANFKGFPSGPTVHKWSLRYDPNGNNGSGSVTVTMDDQTAICHLDPGHKADGASFNRFGLVTVVKQADMGGEVWLDDITVNGETESFDKDPHWTEFQNRRTYITENVRPRFDFGYSSTHHAGGKASGEMGGLIYRGDGRYTNTMAYYGAKLEELTLARPLKASGKITLRRAISDSDVPFGFFHAEHSLNSGGTDRIGTPPDFVGIAIGGPSREGFYFAPSYRLHGTKGITSYPAPYIYPDGASHDWTFEYNPPVPNAAGDAQPATITVSLDGQRATLKIPAEHQATGGHFNRFGFISTHTDGNAQLIYVDDLNYTFSQID
jgi:hypothetical protein